jgi:type II secretory pathway predicted ATPase ExeA
MIERLRSHYGFTRMPFGRGLAPGMLHRHAAHGEAAARISWCISEHALGVITGEVGAGKTVALRAPPASPPLKSRQTDHQAASTHTKAPPEVLRRGLLPPSPHQRE